jgi:catechol 2,3-dioxygenase-like lactoylglutathione lyase family enzyme
MSGDSSSEQSSHIDHVNIVVEGLEPATDFFADLGFEVKAGGSLTGDWINTLVGLDGVEAEFVALALPLGQTVLELLKFKNPTGGVDPNIGKANQIGLRHVAFAITGIDGWYQRLQDMEVECLSPVQDVPNYRGKRMFYFRGPEDILLELAEYPRNSQK